MADTTKKQVQEIGISDTDDFRIHSEAPAEGDTARDSPEIRSHSQDPA